MSEVILRTAPISNKPQPTAYRATYDGEIVSVYQPMFDGTWQLAGDWHLSTLLQQPAQDTLIIDGGQNWIVSGMLGVYKEIQELKEAGHAF